MIGSGMPRNMRRIERTVVSGLKPQALLKRSSLRPVPAPARPHAKSGIAPRPPPLQVAQLGKT